MGAMPSLALGIKLVPAWSGARSSATAPLFFHPLLPWIAPAEQAQVQSRVCKGAVLDVQAVSFLVVQETKFSNNDHLTASCARSCLGWAAARSSV